MPDTDIETETADDERDINNVGTDVDVEPAASDDYVDPDDDALATLEDHTIQRDETGGLKPQRVKNIPELDGADVIARPMTRQERKQYIEYVADENHPKEEVSDAELAELFDEKIVAPDLTKHDLCDGRVTERFIRDGLTSTQEDGFFIAILLASGEHDMVRRMRGEFSDSELKALVATEHGVIPDSTGNRE